MLGIKALVRKIMANTWLFLHGSLRNSRCCSVSNCLRIFRQLGPTATGVTLEDSIAEHMIETFTDEVLAGKRQCESSSPGNKNFHRLAIRRPGISLPETVFHNEQNNVLPLCVCVLSLIHI